MMQIWLTGPRLFMIMETDPNVSPEAKAAADAADPGVRAWEALPWAAPKWTPAACVFDLAQHG